MWVVLGTEGATRTEFTWTRTERIAFRLAMVWAVLAGLRLVPLFAFVVPGVAQEVVRAWLEPVGSSVFRYLQYVGASAIGSIQGDFGWGAPIVARYATDAATAVLCQLIGTAIIASTLVAGWSVVDKRRLHYEGLNAFGRLYVRWLLALVMLTYALVKVVPTQFGFLPPAEALRPLGASSSFSVLWNFMAASTTYTVFTGIVELSGVILLLFSRTAVVGALLLIAGLTNILALNLAFNIRGPAPTATTLLVLSAIVCTPYVRALWSLIVLRQPTQLPEEPPVRRSRPVFVAVTKLAILGMLMIVPVRNGLTARATYFGAGRSVYGLFDVEHAIPPGGTTAPRDAVAWKRVASDGRYGGNDLLVQLASGELRSFRVTDDVANRTLTLRPRDSEAVAATLRYTRVGEGQVTLNGTIGSDAVALSLRRVDPKRYPILPAW